MGIYSICCAGLYSVTSPVEGVQWQRFQVVSLAVLGTALLWFISDYTGKASRKVVIGFTVYYIFAVLSGLFNRGNSIWTNEASIKDISLPFGYEIIYYEMAPGFLTNLQSLVGFVYFIYIFKVGLKFYKSGNKRKGRPLLVAMIFLFVGLMNDTFVSSGFYDSIYILEYSYIGIILLFTYSLTNIILKAGKIQIALRESEAKFRGLVESTSDWIWEVDATGVYTYASPRVKEILGYSPEDILGKKPFDLMPPGENERVFQIFQEQKDRGKPIVVLENVNLHKNGQSVVMETSGTPILDTEGKVIGYRGVDRDITERKKAVEVLRETEEKLARSKKMESLGLLAGGVAHDLNNVLSGIVSYPELLLMDLPEDSKLRKPIETIQDSGHRATAIVQDLLTVARGVATTKEPLNLNDLIGDYLHSPEFSKLKKFHPTVTVKTNLDRELLNISGSHVHIRKVVMNLVSNAAEAIEGNGNVIISTKNYYADRPLKGYDDVDIGEYTILAVSDNGPGISTDDLERIFEPFYTKKVLGRSGTGLGLAVVWNTVQDHHGYVDVISEGNGTTFELYFPITRDEIVDKDLSIPIKDLKGDGETILVVDDVESQRDISCKMLDKLGYKTKAVSSGEEAVEYIKENTVDLLLLDMIMDPGINGRETYERIIKIHPNQKAIIASGFAETDDVKAAQKMGAGKYVKKPATLEMIGLAVKEELEK